ncbi:1-pyrroline-5-carboxylate dehydrogenase [Dictyocaulus viviparus]|uniref:Delta-1-pyrroline-5-carboxylate dehydrogenase, mitochondrial n=1 Tax=Dictyocaulus viviparus TaxID=29172 RepID=A0A0D8XGD8_DICVI|nr:1-pyrroline-5-carboxylate dehydrogenase [Dictyocaulus viviparus]
MAFCSGLTSEQFMKKVTNEPILEYRKGSNERVELEKELDAMSKTCTLIPIRIGTKKITSDRTFDQVMPSDHRTVVAKFTYANAEQISEAIEVALEARIPWQRKSLRERADILLHAADLAAGKYRMKLNAATMLGQGKSIVQAEIDSACELVDFFRFNSLYALEMEKYEPISTEISTNKMHYRGMEGFVAAITPFNFTAIGGNLATAPALMGNVVLWKPSDTAVLSNYIIYQLLEEAGIPPGVISFLPSFGPVFGQMITSDSNLSAINFTGSVQTFKTLWRQVAENLDKYKTFPKLIGECGGKNFHFVHPSANADVVAACTARSAWEYGGQKCSACSRIYVPKSRWDEIFQKIKKIHQQIKLGDVRDGSIFFSAVIDKKSFSKIKSYIGIVSAIRGNEGSEILLGGNYDDSKGYFIDATLVKVTNLKSKFIREEIFGPVLAAYVYDDKDVEQVLNSIKDHTVYGLTGAVFSEDKDFLKHARDVLYDAVGNMYLNDKSTGAVVGQQPFGGARMSVYLLTSFTLSVFAGRRQLREWRERNSRRSEEVVELWEHVVSRSLSLLGDELWIVYEQVCVAALDCARLDLANECISVLNNRFPRSNRVLRLQAMHYEAAEQFDSALALYEQLIEDDPTNNSFRKRKVALFLAQGLRLEAIRELNDYLKACIFLNDTEAWLQLSDLFLAESDLAKAAHCLEECVLAAPLNTLYLRRLADIRYSQGGLENIELARAYYEQAAKLNPSDLRALYGIILCATYLTNHMKGTGGEKKRNLMSAGSAAIDKVLARYEEVCTRLIMEDREHNVNNNQIMRSHHSLLISHCLSTVLHLLSSALLYLTWDSAEYICGKTSIFLKNVQAILTGIYTVIAIVKFVLLSKHFCYSYLSPKFITVISSIVAGKQFFVAVICEAILEGSTMMPTSGCLDIRNTVVCRLGVEIVLPAFDVRQCVVFLVINQITSDYTTNNKCSKFFSAQQIV